MNTEPTNCDTCNADLREHGYSFTYQGDKIISALCTRCDRTKTFQGYLKTKRLRTHLVMDNLMKVYDIGKDWRDKREDIQYLEEIIPRLEIHLASQKIQEKIKEFEQEVWFKGVQDIVLGTRERGVSAHLKTHNNFRVLTWSGMGRTMITIEDDHNSVTCVADETSKESRTGFHGVDAKAEDALALIQLAIDLYKNKTLVFDIDKKVSYCGF
jgi:hypothetical protein